MTTVSFNVQLPDKFYKFSIAKRHKCTFISPIEQQVDTEITKTITPSQLAYAIEEFNQFSQFRRRIFCLLSQLCSVVSFSVVEPKNGGLIDYAWCRRAQVIVWEKVEIDNLMSWLSTLGGGFSSLGDSFETCAARAGRISQYQLKIAMRSGDPSIVVRCKLYYSISLIQRGRFRAAKELILCLYEQAKQERQAGDDRVYKMCHGIWLKLQYSHATSVQNRKKKFPHNH